MTKVQTMDIHEAGLSLDLADMIFETRAGADMTQTQLADAMGVSQSEVDAWETGTEVPRVDMLQRLAQACGKRLHIRIDVD